MDEALKYYEKALKMWEDNFGEANDDVAIMTFAIGTVGPPLPKNSAPTLVESNRFATFEFRRHLRGRI